MGPNPSTAHPTPDELKSHVKQINADDVPTNEDFRSVLPTGMSPDDQYVDALEKLSNFYAKGWPYRQTTIDIAKVTLSGEQQVVAFVNGASPPQGIMQIFDELHIPVWQLQGLAAGESHSEMAAEGFRYTVEAKGVNLYVQDVIGTNPVCNGCDSESSPNGGVTAESGCTAYYCVDALGNFVQRGAKFTNGDIGYMDGEVVSAQGSRAFPSAVARYVKVNVLPCETPVTAQECAKATAENDGGYGGDGGGDAGRGGGGGGTGTDPGGDGGGDPPVPD